MVLFVRCLWPCLCVVGGTVCALLVVLLMRCLLGLYVCCCGPVFAFLAGQFVRCLWSCCCVVCGPVVALFVGLLLLLPLL